MVRLTPLEHPISVQAWGVPQAAKDVAARSAERRRRARLFITSPGLEWEASISWNSMDRTGLGGVEPTVEEFDVHEAMLRCFFLIERV